MKATLFSALLLTATLAAAQTASKPATAAHARTAAARTTLPANIPPVKALTKTAFALRYQEIKIGTGPVAESNKFYQVAYTGWIAADGRKFDSSYDHKAEPILDKDGKPVKGEDGKPKTAPGQPIVFPQGFGRVIPGWDQGFGGMRIGGKRRIFIPYQLAYGAKGRETGDPKNPGIPAKADLIFDVELVNTFDLPKPPERPAVPTHPTPAAPKKDAPAEAKPAAEATKPAAAEPAKPAEPATTTAPATQPK